MESLTEKITSSLKSKNSEDHEEALGYIISIFDKKSGVQPDSWVFPNNQDVANEVITQDKEQIIKNTLCDFIDSNLENPISGSAVFALGKAYDKDLKSYFIKLLEYYISHDASTVYQVLIALENIENLDNITIFGTEGGSFVEEERNVQLAKKYLSIQ